MPRISSASSRLQRSFSSFRRQSFCLIPVVLVDTSLQIHSVVFLNCGAVDSLEDECSRWDEQVRGFVIDSHR
jgi:hypothetical protein